VNASNQGTLIMRLTYLTIATVTVAAPLAAQDYRFTKEISQGGRVEIENINGPIEVVRASGRTAEVQVTKIVKKGDGNMVKAIMEEGGNGMHVCTLYLSRDMNRKSCNGDNFNNDSRNGNKVEVEMRYLVKVPAGARLTVDDVNGNVTVTGVDVDAKIATVNGDVIFDGTGALSLETVNGKIIGTFRRASWEGTMDIQTVNGSVELTFPSDLNADISGETVNGGVDSDFRITVEKGWGPKSFTGRIGSGGRRIKIETVNGGITLRKH